MGEIIVRKVRGMNWKAKIALVLMFTLVFSTFMFQGLYQPKKAEAAVANVSVGTLTSGWAHPSTGIAGPYTITDATFSCGPGSNRLLVVMVETETGTAHVPTMTITKGTGINHTMAVRTPSGRNQVYIGYFTESQINANTNSIVVTNTSGTAWTGSDVYLACFSGVDQASPMVAGGTQSTASDAGTVTTFALSVSAVNTGMVIVGNATNNAANAVTTPAGYTEPFDLAGTGYGTEIAFKAVTATGTETGNFTWTGARCASAAISLNPASSCAAGQPTGLTLGTVTPTSVPLTWTGAGTNNYFRIYRNGTQISTNGSPTTGAYTDNTVTPDTVYNTTGYTVTGYNTAGACESAASTAVAVTTPSVTPVAPTVATPALTTLNVTINTETPANPATTTYAIRINGGAYTNQYIQANGSVGASAVWQNKATWATKTVTGLANGTTYTFDVQARNQALTTTVWGPTAAGTTTSPCAAGTPTALTVGAETTSSVPLTWTGAGTTNYFRVYRGGVQINTDGATTTGSYTDATAVAGSTYSYTVSGYNTAGTCESAQSAAASAYVLPATPAAPTVTNYGDGTSLNVTLGADTNAATVQYAIRINGGAFTNQFVQAGGTVAAGQVWQTMATWGTIRVTGLANATTYTFTVIARNGNGTPDLSAYSAGTAKATSVSQPSTITSCGGCHGYGATFTDGTARNTPAGKFQGSHNTHVAQYSKTCSACHTVPATETSADYDHRDGTINIASPINGAGTYSKASFVQSNGAFAPGTCSNTYCHSNGTSVITSTIPANTSPSWGGTTACNSCHGGTDGRPNYANNSPKRNTHGDGAGYGTTHLATACPTCHTGVAGTAGAYTISDTTTHNNGAYNIQASMGYTQAAGTCTTASCHGAATVTWGGSLKCVDCHASPQGTRADVVAEFGLAWGHKKSGRQPVDDADCIVCHLEGKYSAGVGSAIVKTAFHSGAPGGNIDLRDPDGAGETPITNNSGAAFTFSQYSVSYTAGSRTTTLGNTVAEVVTVKFCMKCHDANGATNPTARSNNGGTGTAFMPFGGVNLGATYTTTNGAAAAGGVIDVAKQFASTNSSRHPVGAANTRMFPYQARLLAPYNNIGTGRNSNTQVLAGTGTRTSASSVILVCDDCHTTGTGVTTRTITAHGNAASLRGTYFVSGPTLCLTCHIAGTNGAYNNTSTTAWPGGTHGAGSGFGTGPTRPAAAMNYCNFCHFSSNSPYAAANRPRYAQDVHGFNEIYGTSAGWTTGSANGMRPIAFMRSSAVASTGSWPTGFSPRPYTATVAGPGQFNLAAGQAQCGGTFTFTSGTSGISCSSNGHTSYGPGGSY